MRAGACAVQQTLSPEASSVLKHSLLLANRRGHAQLTPLHVAATLLTSSSRFSSTLRSSSSSPQLHHSHTLQCRALELCLNVSLNRLPATSVAGGPLLLHSPPSLSNALIAALKRAQAHQRRSGCAEQQQQQNCFLAIKVDLDQLIISILDDPSVSRVMREAGFSSTSVKSNLEDFRKNSFINYNCVNFWRSSLRSDTKSVFDIMLGRKKRKNIVLVGENSSVAEALASQVMVAFERGDVDHEDLESVKLIRLQFSAVPLRLMRRQEVDMNVGDLKRKVESFGLHGKVIIYVGDLKWAVERDIDECSGFYSPVDHLIAEIGDMVSWYNNSSYSKIRVWLMATANYETLMKCKTKEPFVDVLWDLEAVHVPYSSGGLGLNLNATSGLGSRLLSKDNIALACCPQCVSDYEKEYAATSSSSAQIPYRLKSHASNSLHNKQLELTRKYNSLCQNLHGPRPIANNPCYYIDNNHHQSSLDYSLKSTEGKEVKTTLSLGNAAVNEKLSVELRNAVQENVPWQFEAIPLILEALMDICSKAFGEDRLLLVRGNDVMGKRRLAAGIAKAVFGSSDSLLHLTMRNADENFEKFKILEMLLKKPHEEIVVLVEDVNCADPDFVKRFVDGIAKDSRRAIFVLTMDGDTGYYNMMMRESVHSVVRMKLLVHESNQGPRMSEFSRKRKSGRDLTVRVKSQRNSEYSEASPAVTIECSSNAFDLNVKAEDEDDEQGQFSPISSDLTREVTTEQQSSLMFLERIKNQLVFHRDSDKDERAREMFLSKLKSSFNRSRDYITSFKVEENVLEEVLRCSGFHHNNLFEKWVRDVFSTSLGMVIGVGEDREKVIHVRLCLDGESVESTSCGDDGFMGTCLPKMIPLCFI